MAVKAREERAQKEKDTINGLRAGLARQGISKEE